MGVVPAEWSGSVKEGVSDALGEGTAMRTRLRRCDEGVGVGRESRMAVVVGDVLINEPSELDRLSDVESLRGGEMSELLGECGESRFELA